MTVKELINMLDKLPSEQEVYGKIEAGNFIIKCGPDADKEMRDYIYSYLLP